MKGSKRRFQRRSEANVTDSLPTYRSRSSRSHSDSHCDRGAEPLQPVSIQGAIDVPPQHRAFAEAVAASQLQDPMPTFKRLSEETGVPVDDLVHHALVRWVSEGSEALMSMDPRVLDQLTEACDREDWG